MKSMVGRVVKISTILNVVVLIPVISVILLDLVQVERVWGQN
jgi:hypothetical protein